MIKTTISSLSFEMYIMSLLIFIKIKKLVKFVNINNIHERKVIYSINHFLLSLVQKNAVQVSSYFLIFNVYALVCV